jgi:hypothetical protein
VPRWLRTPLHHHHSYTHTPSHQHHSQSTLAAVRPSPC